MSTNETMLWDNKMFIVCICRKRFSLRCKIVMRRKLKCIDVRGMRSGNGSIRI